MPQRVFQGCTPTSGEKGGGGSGVPQRVLQGCTPTSGEKVIGCATEGVPGVYTNAR